MKPELAKVGLPWDGGNIQRWPGVAGISGETNHLAQNINPFFPDPTDSSSSRDTAFVGGKKRQTKKGKRHAKKSKRHTKKGRRHNKKQKYTRRKNLRGGSKHGNTLLPQSLVNLGRTAEYNIKGLWSNFTGSQYPVNPDPTKQPISA